MKLQIMCAAISGCMAGMTIVRHYQLADSVLSAIEKQEDQTLVTIADTESQSAVKSTLAQIHDLAFWGEEGDGRKGFLGDGRYGAIVDPLDGTNAFVIGMITSTVIIGIYDRKEKRLVGCVIGEPISGRIWSATDEDKTTLNESRFCHVWDGTLAKGNVFIDVSHGFKSRGRQILTDNGNTCLYSSLNKKCKIFLPGSNGLMQTLVANGREWMAGSITTAVGFPGDVCGAFLVKQVGGILKAYARNDAGKLLETDPLDPLLVDALICANSAETLAVLAEAFEAAAKVS